MKAQSGISLDNAAVAATPKHLLQFAVDQRYDDYTPVDHAVWRFIMRQNVFFLREYAHKVYFQGLLDTGISFERIPRIEEMNDILGKIEWGAVAVDGFIPPAAFMEFQAYKVLVIACDMRQIHHIEYTPAPDIVHEAAGHAPIIVDREYSNYLQRFGEVGAKAMSSKKDFEPSEMALLSRLHWWTVEYGLIGTMENPKIYGAGLLSSIGESVSCLEPNVKKIPYSIDAMNQLFDITTRQPQLFVCRDFKHLRDVLEEFASKMAYQVGGLEGINKAIECTNVATCQYSSGLQVTGVFDEVIVGQNNNASPARTPIYLHAKGPCGLAFKDKELKGHGRDYHKEGFGSPIGNWKQTPLERGKTTKLEFESGVTVEGKIDKLLERDGKLLLITFSDCTAKYGDRVLFDPIWGNYDMAVGAGINSVFNGAADKDAYNQVTLVPKERTIKVPSDAKRKKLENLYAQVRKIRETKKGYERLGEIWETQQAEHPEDWLLSMEIYEILDTTAEQPQLKAKIEKFLNDKKAQTKDLTTLISWGFRLVEYHKKPEYQAALAASRK